MKDPTDSPNPTPSINWHNLRDKDITDNFISAVSSFFHSNEKQNRTYKTLADSIVSAAKEKLEDVRPHNPPWFHLSAATILPLISTRNATQIKYFDNNSKKSKLDFTTARNAVKKAVIVAKLRWLEIQAKLVKDIKLHPKQAWDIAKRLRAGLSYHHIKPRTDKLKNAEGHLSKNDKEHVKIFSDHFAKVFSRTDISFDKTVMDNILQRPIMNELDEDIAYSELCAILTKMQNHKSSGSNNLPMDALKVMSSRFSIIDLITNFICI